MILHKTPDDGKAIFATYSLRNLSFKPNLASQTESNISVMTEVNLRSNVVDKLPSFWRTCNLNTCWSTVLPLYWAKTIKFNGNGRSVTEF